MGHTERTIVGAVGACLIGSSVLLKDNWWWWLIALGGVILVVLALFVRKSEKSERPENISIPTETGSSLQEQIEQLPAFMNPVFSSGVQEMQQLSPYSWLSGFGPKDPEVTLRVVLALPAVSASDYSGELATEIRGESRENFLIDLLESSETTKWLRRTRESTPGIAEPTWQVRGGSFAELTELVFAPSVGSNQIWPFLSRCAVLTGWRTSPEGVKRKAIRFLIELQLNRWSLSQPQVSDMNDRTEPKQLTLEEIAEDFMRLAESLSLAPVVAAHLIPGADVSAGYFGLWFTVRGHMLEQLVDLSGVNRLPDAVSISDAVTSGSWKSIEGPVDTTWGKVIADMLDHLLESAGYRGVANRFDWMR